MKFLSYGVMTYMLLALIWWTVLLTKNNAELYQTKLQLIKMEQNTDAFIIETINIQSQEIIDLTKKYNRKANMILGEGLVFGLILIIGLWLLQRSFDKELEDAKRQKNFLLSITHELKSPITAVNLIMQTLMRRTLEIDKRNELYNNALDESKRLESLINNLLLSTKLDGNFLYNFEETNIIPLIKQDIEKLVSLHPEIQINLKLPKESILNIDKEAFHSLVFNVLENGVKYNDNIDIQLDVEINENSTHTSLIFKDNGWGIPKNEKENIFLQFYRIGNEETRKTKGTGLGLYIVHKIVTAHKGNIKVLDNSPKGTIFQIILPK